MFQYDAIEDRSAQFLKQDQPDALKDLVRQLTPEGKVVRNNIQGYSLYHRNYLVYLEECYNYHLPIVVSPNYLWQIALTDIAQHVVQNSGHYQEHFTSTPGAKQTISVPTGDLEVMPLNLLREELQQRVPMSSRLFFPEFSTATPDWAMACSAAFAEMASPYYNYMMFSCGFPKILVEGTLDDWKLFKSHVQELTMLDKAQPYLNRISLAVDRIVDNFEDPDFWKNIFYLKNCGSGHQTEVQGWITSFYSEPTPKGIRHTYAFSSNVAQFEYLCVETQKKYKMHYGLFGSIPGAEGVFRPKYGYVVEDVTEC